MTDTITRNTTPAAPIVGLVFVIDYEADLEAGTIVHPKLHGAGFNATLRPARDRSGTLELGFATAAAAWAAVTILRAAATFTLDADLDEISMTFVVAGGALRPRRALAGAAEWTVRVPYVEITG